MTNPTGNPHHDKEGKFTSAENDTKGFMAVDTLKVSASGRARHNVFGPSREFVGSMYHPVAGGGNWSAYHKNGANLGFFSSQETAMAELARYHKNIPSILDIKRAEKPVEKPSTAPKTRTKPPEQSKIEGYTTMFSQVSMNKPRHVVHQGKNRVGTIYEPKKANSSWGWTSYHNDGTYLGFSPSKDEALKALVKYHEGKVQKSLTEAPNSDKLVYILKEAPEESPQYSAYEIATTRLNERNALKKLK